ncbi:MAG: 4Fe-4S binding protein [Synergistaceae bacterium]|nr:4Fe-4S binding protein [Synergistaceae bacterium]
MGMGCFLTPLLLSLSKKGKVYCNKFCGRGQLFTLLGDKYKLSAYRETPSFLRSHWFRYGFLAFFMLTFVNMLYLTYLVFSNTYSVEESLTLLWVFSLPWNWAIRTDVSPWITQFSVGLYGIMMTSLLLGITSMLLFKPRSWCAYCPVGTMTQIIAKLMYRGKH